jgi:hypothetical protein
MTEQQHRAIELRRLVLEIASRSPRRLSMRPIVRVLRQEAPQLFAAFAADMAIADEALQMRFLIKLQLGHRRQYPRLEIEE